METRNFPINGVDYPFTELTYGLKRKYSTWMRERYKEATMDLEQSYRKRARKLRQRLTDDTRARALGPDQDQSALLSDEQREDMIMEMRELEASANRQSEDFKEAVSSGRLHFTGEICIDGLRTAEGTAKLMQIMIEPSKPGFSFEQALDLYTDHTDDCVSAVRELMGVKKMTSPKPPIETTPEETP